MSAFFDDVTINDSLSVNGWIMGRIPNASITAAGNWSESRFSRSPWPRRSYTIPFTKLSQASRVYLWNFYEARNGPVRSFKLWDRDYNNIVNQALATGDGSTTTFQLTATGGDSTNSFQKPIYHPAVTGTAIPYEIQGASGTTTVTTVIKVAGTTLTEGTDYTINHLTGILTFTSAPASSAAITGSLWYYIPVRFEEPVEITLNSIWGQTTLKLIEVFE